MWPDGSKSVEIEATPDSFLETAYEVTDSDIWSRAKPAYQYTLDNNG